MINLLHHPEGPLTYHLRVLLDINAADIELLPDELGDLFSAAQSQNRKVGCIQRGFGGDTYFTYDPANQAQHEISLIAALSVPKADVHVEQINRGYRK